MAAASDLEARAAVSRVIGTLGDPAAFQDPSLVKWFEDGKEEEDEEEAELTGESGGHGMDSSGMSADEDDEAMKRVVDEDAAVESGGLAW